MSVSSNSSDSEEQRDQLTDVYGIADVRADSFVEAGYKTIHQVSQATVAEIAENVYGLGETDAEKILRSANELVAERGVEATGASDEDVQRAVEREERRARRKAKGGDQGVTPEVFESRLYQSGGGDLVYRVPNNDVLLPPHRAPGFEAWCESRGKDADEMRAKLEDSEATASASDEEGEN